MLLRCICVEDTAEHLLMDYTDQSGVVAGPWYTGNDKFEFGEVSHDESNTKETGGCHKNMPEKGCDIKQERILRT